MPSRNLRIPDAASSKVDALVDALRDLDAALSSVSGFGDVSRVRHELAATRYHATRYHAARDPAWRRDGTGAGASPGGPLSAVVPVVVLLGGTGVGKSTLVNRLLGRDETGTDPSRPPLTRSSFRRTFTSGPVVVTADPAGVPEDWGGFGRHDVIAPDALPAAGAADTLTVVTADDPPLPSVLLVDTPDVDGERPAHHALAERCFRYADAVLFVVTPEKYQMTELVPLRDLAARYAVPSLHVMNKVDDAGAADDFLTILPAGATLFVVPRDGNTYRPGHARGVAGDLDALRDRLQTRPPNADPTDAAAGVRRRAADVMTRAHDAVLEPLERHRAAGARAADAVRALVRPDPTVDVHPMTAELEQRFREKSLFYLMSVERVVDRATRLFTFGRYRGVRTPTPPMPDLPKILHDLFLTHQARVTDALGGASPAADGGWRRPTEDAADIARRHMDDLHAWLTRRAQENPRDTRLLLKLFGQLPGGQRVVRLAEAAPYLLVVASVATNAVVGPVDLLVYAGYAVFNHFAAQASNDVTRKAVATNAAILRDFTALCDEQTRRAVDWLRTTLPDADAVEGLRRSIDDLADLLEDPS